MYEPELIMCERAEPDSAAHEAEYEPVWVEVDGAAVVLLLDDGTELAFERAALVAAVEKAAAPRPDMTPHRRILRG
jgi:hypothetical protein